MDGFGGLEVHQLCGRGRGLSALEIGHHLLENGHGLFEESLEADAEMMVARRVGSDFRPMVFGAATRAILDVLTAFANVGQLGLELGKFVELGRLDELAQWRFEDVADLPLGEHEVVAGVEVAVGFEDVRVGAALGIAAQRRAAIEHGVEDRVDQALADPADVARGPQFERFAEEVAILFARARKIGRRTIGVAFEDWDELDVLDSAIGEVAIDLARVGRVLAVEGDQDVEFYPVFAAELYAVPGTVEAPLAVVVEAEVVVPLRRAIEADSDEEVVFLEELAPFRREGRAVGLQRVVDLLGGALVLVLKFDSGSEKVESCEGRFAALPAKFNVEGLAFDVLLGVAFEDLEGHGLDVAAVEKVGLVKIVAIFAGEVAASTDGLAHNLKRVKQCHEIP